MKLQTTLCTSTISDFDMENDKPENTRRRTRARELVLEALYIFDQRADLSVEQVASHVDTSGQEGEVQEYAQRLLWGILKDRDQLDKTIRKIAVNWEISRMPVVDRNILRLATYEILHCEDIPRKVAINEAIDMAKKYSTAESGSFVNGILDKVQGEE